MDKLGIALLLFAINISLINVGYRVADAIEDIDMFPTCTLERIKK